MLYDDEYLKQAMALPCGHVGLSPIDMHFQRTLYDLVLIKNMVCIWFVIFY